MNASELAKKMLEWELKYRELDILEQEINLTVLEMGKTQTVGNVRATYSKGRNEYDYETPGSRADQEKIDLYTEEEELTDWEGLARNFEPSETEIARFTEVEKTIQWRKVCKGAEIDPFIISQGEPKVKVKLLD